MSTTRAVSKSSAAHSPYQRLFMLPGAKAFCLSGAVARLPISMMSLGIVLALNHLYDNWTIAGTMSAAYVLAMSCVTPFYARAFDRFGQARVGRLALAVQIVAMLAFAFAALVRVPIPLLFALAIIMGLTQFSFGALVRTRWSYALRGVEDGEQLLNTAYAMEAAIDEIVFISGADSGGLAGHLRASGIPTVRAHRGMRHRRHHILLAEIHPAAGHRGTGQRGRAR